LMMCAAAMQQIATAHIINMRLIAA
jgi:hypothetical protein